MGSSIVPRLNVVGTDPIHPTAMQELIGKQSSLCRCLSWAVIPAAGLFVHAIQEVNVDVEARGLLPAVHG
jgi:hypothetical protein